MREETTLDAFLDDEGNHDEDADSPPGPVADEDVESDTDGESVSAITSTVAWSATPVECPRCADRVHRRYREDDGSLVCRSCKRW